MAAPTIAQIMTGIETRLKTVSGLRTNAYVADQINPPHAVIHLPEPIDYHSTMQRGYMEMDFTITVLISAVLDRIGQVALGTYLDAGGSKSVTTAIEGDRTLGITGLDCIVTGARALNQEEVNGLGYYGGRWTLRVVAPGS